MIHIYCNSSQTAWSWRWRHYDPSKSQELLTKFYSITSQDSRIIRNTTV